ncbi:MAG: sigma-54 dependent transcriptional regulator [Candidatus Manganitrophus sp. SA1]|nr:sigma-54 dependent transcriptional regulator [Candidatus Manganitrophus morganii]
MDLLKREKGRILLIEKSPEILALYRSIADNARYETIVAREFVRTCSIIKKERPVLIIMEIGIHGDPQKGLLFIERALRLNPDVSIAVASNTTDSKIIDKALGRGAIDYIDKSKHDRLSKQIEQIVMKVDIEVQNNRRVDKDGGFRINTNQIIVGTSPLMRQIYKLIPKVAETRASVLICGESGTGKELIARAIHAQKGIQAPFIPIDCGCMTKSVLESELFGVRAKYPGFHNTNRLVGKFEAAGRGTLLLDEIGNMPADIQPALLRVLWEREFHPLGFEKPMPLQSQVISSTNIELEELIRRGRFREDLYFRLNTLRFTLPPLRKRREDIPLLIQHFLEQHEKKSGEYVEIVPEAIEMLTAHNWPGNIRELAQTLWGTLTTSQSHYLVPRHFALLTRNNRSFPVMTSTPKPFRESVTEFQKQLIVNTLNACNGNRNQAAKELGIARGSLFHFIRKFGIEETPGSRNGHSIGIKGLKYKDSAESVSPSVTISAGPENGSLKIHSV